MQSYDLLKLAYDAKRCLHYHSGPMIVASMKTYQLKLLYILNEKPYFQKLFYFTDKFLLFAKRQVKSLKSQAKIDFFPKLSTAFLGSKTVENMRISSFIVKTKNVTKSNS